MAWAPVHGRASVDACAHICAGLQADLYSAGAEPPQAAGPGPSPGGQKIEV